MLGIRSVWCCVSQYLYKLHWLSITNPRIQNQTCSKKMENSFTLLIWMSNSSCLGSGQYSQHLDELSGGSVNKAIAALAKCTGYKTQKNIRSQYLNTEWTFCLRLLPKYQLSRITLTHGRLASATVSEMCAACDQWASEIQKAEGWNHRVLCLWFMMIQRPLSLKVDA